MPHDSKKQILRKQFSNLRNNVSSEEASFAAKSICEQFFSTQNITQDDIVAGYFPTKHELSPLPILEQLNKNGVRTALPVIAEKEQPLIFRTWKEGDALERSNNCPIKEPLANAEELTPTIIITPALSFDSDNHRLGYGGGFYDRTISHLKNNSDKFITIGIAYKFQLCDSLPRGTYDEPVDFVLSQ